MSLINFNTSLSLKVTSIGKRIFNADDISLLEKALTECSQEYSYVIMKDSEPIGFALVKAKFKQANSYELAFLGIHPDHQGHGWGQRLLREVDSSIPHNSSLWLLVNQDNFPAQNMYSKFGFHILCDCLDPYMVPCYLMVKNNTVHIPQSLHRISCIPESPHCLITIH